MNENTYRDAIATALRAKPDTVITPALTEGSIILSGETLSGKTTMGPWMELMGRGADTKAR